MGEPTVVSQLARIQCQPGKAAQLISELQVLETCTRREPGCQEFTFYQAISDASEFVLIERFHDAQALQCHMDADHTQRFFALGWVTAIRVQPL